MPQPVIVWFRQDLRLNDNPAFAAAIRSQAPIIPVFIDDTMYGRPAGQTSLWWRNKSLAALADALGDPLALLGVVLSEPAAVLDPLRL